MDRRSDMSLFLLSYFAMCAVVDDAGKATFPAGMSAIISALYYLWGRARASTFVEKPVGTTSLLNGP